MSEQYDWTGLLTELTGCDCWMEAEGVTCGLGRDWFYRNDDTNVEASINLDGSCVTVTVDGDEVLQACLGHNRVLDRHVRRPAPAKHLVKAHR